MFHGEHAVSRSADLTARLARYEALVRRWSERLDLVGARDLERFSERHVEDSLRALPLVRALPAGAAVDVGSGAGLPGIPLALAQPERPWRLLEPRRRRAAFLEEVVRELGLACEVLPVRAEEAAASAVLRRAHVVATARALAPPERAWRLLEPLLRAGGAGLLWVGAAARLPLGAEIAQGGVAMMRATAKGED
jgi:16S rRNA (guanine527-N7)-methyltransferase